MKEFCVLKNHRKRSNNNNEKRIFAGAMHDTRYKQNTEKELFFSGKIGKTTNCITTTPSDVSLASEKRMVRTISVCEDEKLENLFFYFLFFFSCFNRHQGSQQKEWEE
jgi:hypothetical protein